MLNDALNASIFAQRHRFGLWVPVWLAIGIGLYFSRSSEPAGTELVAIVLVFIGVGAAIILSSGWLRVIAWIPLFVGLGVVTATTRAQWVSAPKLGWHYFGPIEGTVSHLDRSGSNKPRLTLIEPVLAKIPAAKTPHKVRISLHSSINGTTLLPGARVMLTGSLSPPAGPVEPGGFDFQRKAWFTQLGGVGYTRTPVVLANDPVQKGLGLYLFAMRMRVSNFIRAEIPGQSGAFAAAIITGDRSQIDPLLIADLRQSNLAHLLAISGLHMGLLTGFIFAIVRISIALIPPLAVRMQAKKIGAAVALAAGLFYLLISGANVATQRAFVMVAVMLVAVLLDRPAITLRSVAIAATIILVARPESLVSPGFQMSFAATTALVFTFEALNRSRLWGRFNSGRLRVFSPVLALVISSAVAGFATAPFSAFHFNQTAQYGLIANLLSVPVMGLFVMPSAVLAGLLSAIGLQGLPFLIMSAGIDWILKVAYLISNLEGAVIRIPSAEPILIGLISLGNIFFFLWVGKIRVLGLLVFSAALIMWFNSKRPDVLITENGRLVGLKTQKGRALNREKGNGFAAKNWLENDADAASQSVASARETFPKQSWSKKLRAGSISYHWGKKVSAKDLSVSCSNTDIVLAPQWNGEIPGRCVAVTKEDFKTGGSIAIWSTEAGLKMKNARQESGTRLWNRQ